MQIIDAHQHFWQYSPLRHAWISDEMAAIRKDYLPKDLELELLQNKVDGCITIQVDQSEQETTWMLSQAEENSFIKGVVGWVDLQAKNVSERLQYFSSFPKLKGFRHILQSEKPSFMGEPFFVNGIRQLKHFNFTYDILIYPLHLKAALQLVKKFPTQNFVIDHLAKPFIKGGNADEWKKNIEGFGRCENVSCKISGMVTEADWGNWKPGDLHPHLDTVLETFGTKRILFGSDWPVCLIASSYGRWLQTLQDYFSGFSVNEQENFFSENAKRFYNL